MMNILTEDDSRITQPSNIKISLFNHQKTIIKKMSDIEQTHTIETNLYTLHTNMGILCDKVGAGKTLSIVSLLASQPPPTNKCQISKTNNTPFMQLTYKVDTGPASSNLIIVPHSLVPQWIETLKLSSLKYHKIQKKAELDFLGYDDIKKFDVILLSSTHINGFFGKWLMISNTDAGRWNRIIIDEPHVISGLKIDFFDYTNFVWLICATPESIISDAYKIIFKYLFGKCNRENSFFDSEKQAVCVKNKSSYIDKSIKLIPFKITSVQCLTPAFINILGSSIPSRALELLHSGSTSEAISYLNCNADTSDNIVKSLTNYYRNKLTNLNFKIQYIHQINISDRDREERLKQPLIDKEKLEQTIQGIKDRIENASNDLCPICFDNFNVPVASNCCQNIFCMECLLQCASRTKKCPLCRDKIDTSKLHAIVSENETTEQTTTTDTLPTKDDSLVDILKNAESFKKFLVVSNYDSTFTNIQQKLLDNNIKFSMISGTSAHIQKVIRDYVSGEIQVILLNSTHFGSGLNLEMTTDVVIYHKLKKSTETQVIGRAQRLGRTSQLNVTYLKHTNEYM